MNMSSPATKQDIVDLKQDITDIRDTLKESFADVTSLLQVFMQQVDDRFNQVEAEQEKTRKEISRTFDYLDSLLKKQDISDDERLVMGHHLDRLDKWTHELADKIGHKLAV
jgi:uncharacterized protein Yka (UPF0111/DUF47 family)